MYGSSLLVGCLNRRRDFFLRASALIRFVSELRLFIMTLQCFIARELFVSERTTIRLLRFGDASTLAVVTGVIFITMFEITLVALETSFVTLNAAAEKANIHRLLAATVGPLGFGEYCSFWKLPLRHAS